jgi:manganese transport protein
MAGQVVMQGFMRFNIPLFLRRTITMLPALIVILLGFEPTAVLVLSFGIPFALILLLQLTRDRALMAERVNRPLTNVFGWDVAAVIIALNIFSLAQFLPG